MLVQGKIVETVSNNLANANTPGFCKSLAVAEACPETELTGTENHRPENTTKTPLGFWTESVMLTQTALDPGGGEIRRTGNPLDCAIKGEGYFQVTDGDNYFYTRAGNFTLDSGGRIVTQTGLALAGDVSVGEATKVEIRENGAVLADGEDVGRLSLFRFEKPSFLEPLGGTLLAPTEGSGEAIELESERVKLEPESLEGSNVNILEEMVRMIGASRAYEAASRAFDTESESGGKMIEAFGL